jgi:hypothetical protein
MVWALSVHSGKLFRSAVSNIHFEKNLTTATITQADAEQFVRRYYSQDYGSFRSANEGEEYPLYLNVENLFSALEDGPVYRTLYRIVASEAISTPEDKAFLGCFVFLHLLRGHVMMNAMALAHTSAGGSKFEHLMRLRWFLSNPDILNDTIGPLVRSHWTLRATHEPTFPLGDSPILVRDRSVMVPLSPTLLLEILLDVPAGEHQCTHDDFLPHAKLADFTERSFASTFREFIFGTPDLLEAWASQPQFRDRCKAVAAPELRSNLLNLQMSLYTQLIERLLTSRH